MLKIPDVFNQSMALTGSFESRRCAPIGWNPREQAAQTGCPGEL
jgi:hypothetical protein